MPDTLNPSDFFDGTIFARGIDIPEGINDPPLNEDRIRWINQTTGNPGSQIYAMEVAGSKRMVVLAGGDNSTNGELFLLASSNTLVSELLVEADDGSPASTRVLVNLNNNGIVKTLLDGNGASDWRLNSVKLVNADVDAAAAIAASKLDPKLLRADESGMKTIRGRINTTAPTILQGTGFTVARNGVGDVSVTYTSVFSGVPSQMDGVELSGVTQVIGEFVGAAANTFRYIINRRDTGAAIDSIFSFTATGPF